MQNIAEALPKLTELRRQGVRVAVDDFGAGYSSLAYLRRLPVDTLKIDRCFVQEIGGEAERGAKTGAGVWPSHGVPGSAAPTGGRDAAQSPCTTLAAAILLLGRQLGLSVIAEGVETETQRQFLLQNGCDGMQGYLFGAPEPPARIEARFHVACPGSSPTPRPPPAAACA